LTKTSYNHSSIEVLFECEPPEEKQRLESLATELRGGDRSKNNETTVVFAAMCLFPSEADQIFANAGQVPRGNAATAKLAFTISTNAYTRLDMYRACDSCLKDNREFIQFAVKKEVYFDEDEMAKLSYDSKMIAVEEYSRHVGSIRPEDMTMSLALCAVKGDPCTYKLLPDRFKSNEQVVVQALHADNPSMPKLFYMLPPCMSNNARVVKRFLENGLWFSAVSQDLHEKYEVVEAAAKYSHLTGFEVNDAPFWKNDYLINVLCAGSKAMNEANGKRKR
jgi:hypothetical protein